jgi:hypothetical protein
MNARKIAVMIVGWVFLAAPAWADWIVGDPYKMHYPQLPDPNGWDVPFDELVPSPDPNVVTYRGPLADDWQCSQTGTVDDIHLWVSFRDDNLPAATEFVAGFVEIWSNVAVAADGVNYSHPGERLWGMGFDTKGDKTYVSMNPYGLGSQGWYAPYNNVVVRPDHHQYFQVNIDPVSASGIAPFVQQQGDVYWLVAHMMVLDRATSQRVGKEIGWKTSLSTHFMDDAVYGSPIAAGPVWVPMVDPFTRNSLDLAFVITGVPEPSTILLLVVGAVGIAVYTRRTR